MKRPHRHLPALSRINRLIAGFKRCQQHNRRALAEAAEERFNRSLWVRFRSWIGVPLVFVEDDWYDDDDQMMWAHGPDFLLREDHLTFLTQARSSCQSQRRGPADRALQDRLDEIEACLNTYNRDYT